jgi:AP-3 complex subunit delta-1
MELRRHDPYYIPDKPSSTPGTDANDIDAIPVVRLDDLPPLSQGLHSDDLASYLN